MNKLKVYFSLLILLKIMNSCSMYKITATFKSNEIDFTNYASFAWLPDQFDSLNLPYNNEIVRSNIKNYFSESFKNRGYVLNTNEPDLLLKLNFTNKKTETLITYSIYPESYYNCRYYFGSSYYFPYSFDYYYSNSAFFCYPTNFYTQIVETIESGVVLNVIDRAKNQLIWSSTAIGNIYHPIFLNKNIHPAVEAIMRKFPIKIKK